MEETSLIAFKAVCNFVNDLESEYGKRHKPLKLYKRLINHTQIAHDHAMRKHLIVFHDFCVANRDALVVQDVTKLVMKKLEYSERVFIDMDHIFHIADAETTPVIWRHLLTISALLDPTGKAKEILKKASEDGKSGKDETDFLSNIISKVEKSVKPDANPMEAVSSIMQSGIFTEMMSDLGSKKLDLGKLLGAVQGMVTTLSNQAGDDPEAKQAMGMLSNVTSMMGNMGNNNGAPPDMSGMMQMMTTMMAGMKPPSAQVEEVRDVPRKEEKKKD
jgi:hypothetical protein